ncbi:type II secretion system protein M [Roseateles oligotrophus]|uniref:Type II secretion system protein M n=1 Tax=Roseateles oligotrophus TaxID=1769250 RepID=A0ABT2YET3_9BURK|nr:type II secretion system protein M [Roseateles oligotrophus]MCV2368547.1 type II secretion system protein M [Roseateles oligotrophus]
MNQPKLPNWQALKAQAQTRWQAMADREQLALQFVAWILALLMVWLLGIQPGLRTLRQAPAQLEALELQLQEMQALAAETRELRATPPVPIALAAQALQAASEHLGAGAKLSVNGDRAVLSVNGVAAEPLQAWLGEVRSAARARPLEAKLQRSANGYSGTIVLMLSGAAP